MITVPDLVLPTANTILEHLCDTLEDVGYPVIDCCVGFGTPPPAQNYCALPDPEGGPDREGMAWIQIGQAFPVATFPVAQELPSKCPNLEMAQQYNVGIYRCAPTLHDDGSGPDCEEQRAALFRQTQDAQLIRRAIRCALEVAKRRYVLGFGTPLDPLGGCMGYTQAVTVALRDCLDCEPFGESS